MESKNSRFNGPDVAKNSTPNNLGRQFNLDSIHDLGQLNEGDLVLINSLDQLDQFEEAYVRTRLPESKFDDSGWLRRTKLSSELRPNKFNGTLINIAAEVMPDAYPRLSEHLPGAQRANIDEAINNTIGFRIVADKHSTGKGIIGTTEIWSWAYTLSSRSQKFYGRLRRKIIRLS